MKLTEYLKQTTQREFAEKLGVTQGLISQWILNNKAVPPTQCIKIERITSGLVTRQELRDDWQEIWPTDLPVINNKRQQTNRRENNGRRTIN